MITAEHTGLEVTLLDLFGRCFVRTSAGTPADFTEVFRGFFFKFLQANAGIVPRLGQHHRLPNSNQFIIILPFDVL
jgi:hypothetical protein